MKRSWLPVILILVLVSGVFFFAKSFKTVTGRSTGVPPVMEKIQRQAGRLPTQPSLAGAPAPEDVADRIAPFLSAPISIKEGGTDHAFELATDQLYLRSGKGGARLLQIPQTKTPEAFTAAIEKARAEHGSEPELVLYLIGYHRNEYTRRIVTRDVVITADSRAEADRLAQTGRLTFKKGLSFDRNSYVYEAATSLEAMDFQVRANSLNLANVSTQFARQAATMAMPNDPYVPLQWHLKNTGQKLLLPGGVENYTAAAGIDINVESVWKYPSTNSAIYHRGQGITIGIVDDSLQWNHPDLSQNMRNELNWDWNQDDADPSPYYSSDSHGTACAGVAAASGNNRIGGCGVAPEASLVGMRLIGEPATDLDEAEAMAWKADQIEIKSNSWGYPQFDTSKLTGVFLGWYPLRKNSSRVESALKFASEYGRSGRGTIFTFAAGNDYKYALTKGNYTESGARMDFDAYPSSIYTIAVGAIDSSGKKSDYSQIGAALLISAPSSGEIGILTTDNRGRNGYNTGLSGKDVKLKPDIGGSGDNTKNFGGTSSATPAVSGVIALMLQANPKLGWRDVQEILIRSAAQVDADDAGWITANRTNHIAGGPPVTIHFNDQYGAGMVDAAAAVGLASSWTNLGPQESQSYPTEEPTPIDPNATVTHSFTVDGTDLRTEHVTLELSVTDIAKGDLTIKLISPGNTTSIFCLPHSDGTYTLENWQFMSVRNWGEMSNGTWTLEITNNGTTPGNLENAELVIYGSEIGTTNPNLLVKLETDQAKVFQGANLTLTAKVYDRNSANASVGDQASMEAFVDGLSLGNSTSGTWKVRADQTGNFNFTVNATRNGSTTTSAAVPVEVMAAPIAAWDFDTAESIPLATVVQSVRKYPANFGNGTLVFDGSYTDEAAPNSNRWDSGNGEIYHGAGTEENAQAEMNEKPSGNKALLLRGGKNLGAEGKWLVFEFSTEGLKNLNFSYATKKSSSGFANQEWSWSTDGRDWNSIGDSPLLATWNYSTKTLTASGLANQPQAFMRVVLTGVGQSAGTNLLDNIIISAEPIESASSTDSPFSVLTQDTFSYSISNQTGNPAPTSLPDANLQAESPLSQPVVGEPMNWIPAPGGDQAMFLHAEVVDGAKFLNAPGSLIAASSGGRILGVGDTVPQTTRFDLGISLPKPEFAPMVLKVYDSSTKSIFVLEEKVPFLPGTIVGTAANPIRFQVAYQESEQLVPVATGWNQFTTSVSPEPAPLRAVLTGYAASEGDRLVGPSQEARVVLGEWTPSDFEMKPSTTYSLLRQSPGEAQIRLRGKATAIPVGSPAPVATSGQSSTPLVAASPAATAPVAASNMASEFPKKISKKAKAKKIKKGKSLNR